eukprot:m.5148 g.5148  ORF g.5148 m.5148 type:complete len:69 (+) comp2345_c0_seq1:1778-1984(+)
MRPLERREHKYHASPQLGSNSYEQVLCCPNSTFQQSKRVPSPLQREEKMNFPSCSLTKGNIKIKNSLQ